MSVSTNVFQRKEPEHGIPDYRAELKDCGKRLKVLAGVSFTGSEDKDGATFRGSGRGEPQRAGRVG